MRIPKGLIDNLRGSFETKIGGSSAKKLSAFAIMVCVVLAHFVWLKHCLLTEDFSQFTTVLTIDFAFVASLLGITAFENKKKGKDGVVKEEPS